jgi:hypothetical protein
MNGEKLQLRLTTSLAATKSKSKDNNKSTLLGAKNGAFCSLLDKT